MANTSVNLLGFDDFEEIQLTDNNAKTTRKKPSNDNESQFWENIDKLGNLDDG